MQICVQACNLAYMWTRTYLIDFLREPKQVTLASILAKSKMAANII